MGNTIAEFSEGSCDLIHPLMSNKFDEEVIKPIRSREVQSPKAVLLHGDMGNAILNAISTFMLYIN